MEPKMCQGYPTGNWIFQLCYEFPKRTPNEVGTRQQIQKPSKLIKAIDLWVSERLYVSTLAFTFQLFTSPIKLSINVILTTVSRIKYLWINFLYIYLLSQFRLATATYKILHTRNQTVKFKQKTTLHLLLQSSHTKNCTESQKALFIYYLSSIPNEQIILTHPVQNEG